MPEAKTLDFCPQCGCTAVTIMGNTPTGASRTFRCGESVSMTHGRVSTNYRCASIGQTTRRLELAISGAIKTLDRVKLTADELHILRIADVTYGTNVYAVIPDSTTSRRVPHMARAGLIEPGKDKGLVRITEWGHMVYQQRKDAVT